MTDTARALGYSMDDVARIDLAPWGYAPGSNSFYCDTCSKEPYPTGNWPHLGHKHSTHCIEHAIEARLRDLRCLEEAPAQHLELEHYLQDDANTRHIQMATISLCALVGTVAVALFATL